MRFNGQQCVEDSEDAADQGMNSTFKWAICMTALSAAVAAGAQNADMKVVYRRNNDLFVLRPDGTDKQLTHDGVPKGNATWSKDGSKIAFLRQVDPNIALGDLVVIDPESDRTIANILICPTQAGVGYFVQEIDDIQWISASKIVVTGALNPSTIQSMVMDIRTGQDVDDVFDDDGAAVFSPDGEHVATVRGSPHFTPESEQEPELDIDGKQLFPPKGERVRFLSEPVWSPDGTQVAAVTQEMKSNAIQVADCIVPGACQPTAIHEASRAAADNFQVQWSNGRVYVSSQTGRWSMQRGDRIATVSTQSGPVSFNAEDTEAEFESKIEQLGGETARNLIQQVRERDGLEPDLWCQNCGLVQLPREVHHL